jgi:hypothetical protein
VLWQQTADVNRKTAKFLVDAIQPGGVRADAQQDLAQLRLSHDAGLRAARLLAAYHSTLSSAGDPSEALAMCHEFVQWMRRNMKFDFTDPKGGDPSSWLEAAEVLRGELLAPQTGPA